MKLDNHFWYFKSAVPPRLCDEIIKYALLKKDHMGRTGGVKDEKLSDKQIKDIKYRRDSNVVWLNDPWIYRELHPYIHAANKNAGWNFQWDTSEQLQFTKYKLNQYYDWHQDSFNKPFDKPNTLDHGKIRKLSMTCQLTDSSEYEGGELEFDFRDYDPPQRDEAKHLIQAKQILSKGSIIVFPSFVWHRVKPVRKGVRYSLVMWNLGYPFK